MLRPSSFARLGVLRPSIRLFSATPSPLSAPDPKKAKTNDSAEHAADKYPSSEEYRQKQINRPLNPHLTNTTSTATPAQPSMAKVGAANAPPELISAVDPEFTPTDTRNPENMNRMTGGTQPGKNETGTMSGEYSSAGSPGLSGSFGDTTPELGPGELPEGKFRIEPLRRTGEDVQTMRARLLYQSRKRGILETDLLLSTFAHDNLEKMERDELENYDRFLDENDWDIYYWATQTPPTTVTEYAEGGSPRLASDAAKGKDMPDAMQQKPPPSPTDAPGRLDNGMNASAAETAEGGNYGGKTHVKDLQTPPPSPTDAPEKLGMSAKGAEDTVGQDFREMRGAEANTGSSVGFGEGPQGEWAQTVGRSKEPYRPPPSRWRDSKILAMIRGHVEARKGRRGMQGEPGGLGRMPDFK